MFISFSKNMIPELHTMSRVNCKIYIRIIVPVSCRKNYILGVEIIIVSIDIIVSINRSTLEYGGRHFDQNQRLYIFDSFSITSQNKVTKESEHKITAELTYIRVDIMKSRLQTKRLIKNGLTSIFVFS